MTGYTAARLLTVLQERFGREQFRANQLEIIHEALANRDLLVVLPTGHGKSLTFQVPAVLESEDGNFSVVISPLLALIKDQVDQLQAIGINAQTLNSSMQSGSRTAVMNQVSQGGVCLLYVSPEQCLTSGFRSFLKANQSRLRRIVVDEAHCAVEWGSDFRKDYAKLGPVLRAELPGVPFMALTGTASPLMQNQIISTLGMNSRMTRVFKGSMLRPHLHYEVRYVEDAYDRLQDLIKFLKMYRARLRQLDSSGSHIGGSEGYAGCGIIYCRSRASTEMIASELNSALGQCAAAYHAQLSKEERDEVMQHWIRGDPAYSVVVATIAFGLGIDKPDTRFIVHIDMPQNMEAYVQQTGRAGRDRRAGRCILYYSAEESRRCQQFGRVGKDDKTAVHSATLALLNFAKSTTKCRHAMLSQYFGDTRVSPGSCEFACDYCKAPGRLRQRYQDWYAENS